MFDHFDINVHPSLYRRETKTVVKSDHSKRGVDIFLTPEVPKEIRVFTHEVLRCFKCLSDEKQF